MNNPSYSPAASIAVIYLKETKYELFKILRLPRQMAPTILFPLMFYILFGLAFNSRMGSGGSAAVYLLATFGAYGAIGLALYGFGLSVSTERAQGWLEVKRASPMPPAAYFTAKLLVSMIFACVIVLLLFALGVMFGNVRMPAIQALELGLVLVAGTIPFCAMGLAVAYLAGPNSAPGMVSLIYLPMSFFSGLWIPIDFMPPVLQKAAWALPPFHFGQLALKVIDADRGGSVLLHISVLAIFAVICMAAATIGFRRDEGKTWG
jgi:ABC-2 type transport system permease protein